MKHRISKVLSLLCLLAVLCGLSIPSALAANKYDDTEGHWAESSIQRWSDYNIVEGEDGSFKPNDSITRAQMAKVIANTLGLTEEAANSFTDVANDAWYAPYILRCNAAGIILGDNGKANPNAVITRQEAMVMLARALEITPASESELAAFADKAQVEAWAAPYVAAMVKSGIVGGVDSNHVAPKDSMTRAEMMTVLDRSIVQYINKSGNYELTDKDGIVLVAAGDVTLSGKTSADVLVSSAAAGKALTFDKATVSGAINVQAANVNVVNNNSTLPKITVKNSGSQSATTTTPETTPVVSGGGGGGGGGVVDTPKTNDLTVSESKTVASGTYDSVTIAADVGDDDVTLNGVIIKGNLTINGGGSSSVHLKNCTIGGKIIAAKSGGAQTLRVELENTHVKDFEAQKPVIVEANDSKSGIDNVVAKADLEVRGGNTTISNVSVPAKSEVKLNVAAGNVGTVEAKGNVTVTGDKGKVDKVVAETDLKVSGENTAISNITVPADKTVKLDVASGNVGTVEAKGDVTVTGDKGSVANVVAEKPVTVESTVVKNVEIPKTVTIVIEITITGNEDVAVMVNGSEAVSIVADGKGDVSVSSDLDTPPTVKVNDKAVEHIHKWVAKVTKEASCSEVGEQTFTCSGCNEIKTEEIAKTAHTPEVVSAKAASCTETGLTEGSKCSVCGEELVKQEVIPATGHTVVTDAAVEATCTTAGKTEGSHCSVCGEELKKQEVIKPLGHDFSGDYKSDAEGHWRVCSRCDETEEKAAHKYSSNECTVEQTCTDCGYVKPAGEHTWNDGEVTTEPTESSDGVKTYTCTVCGKTKTESIPAVTEEVSVTLSLDESTHKLSLNYTEPDGYDETGSGIGLYCYDSKGTKVGYTAIKSNGNLTYPNGVDATVVLPCAPSDGGTYTLVLKGWKSNVSGYQTLATLKDCIEVTVSGDAVNYDMEFNTAENQHTITVATPPELCYIKQWTKKSDGSITGHGCGSGNSTPYTIIDNQKNLEDGDTFDLRYITAYTVENNVVKVTMTPQSVKTYTDKKPETSETLYGIVVNGGNEAVSIFTSDGEVKDYTVPASVIGYRTGDYVSYTLKGDEINSITVVDEPDSAHWKIGVVSADYFPAITQVRSAADKTLNWNVDGTTYIVDGNTAVSDNVDSIFDVEDHQGLVCYTMDDGKYYVNYIYVKSYTKTVTDAPILDGTKIRVGGTSYNRTNNIAFSTNADPAGLRSKNSYYTLYFNADDQVYYVESDRDRVDITTNKGISYYVKSVDTSSIRVLGGVDGAVIVTKNMKDSDTLIYTDNGFIAPSELKVGDAIQQISTNLYVKVSDAKGTLTRVTPGSQSKVIIGGKTYVYGRSTVVPEFYDADFEAADSEVADVQGNEVTVLVNKDNSVSVIVVDGASIPAKHYGIFVAADTSGNSIGGGTIYNVTFFTDEGKNVTYNINKDKKVAVYNALAVSGNASVKYGYPFEYRLNKSGEVTSVIPFTDFAAAGSEIEVKNDLYLVSSSLGTFTLASDVVIFEVGSDDTEADPSLGTSASVLTGGDFTPDVVDLSTSGSSTTQYIQYVESYTNAGVVKALAYTKTKPHDSTLDENDFSDTMYGVVTNTEGTSISLAYTNNVVIYTSEGEQVQYSLGDFDKDEISKMVGKLVAYKVYSGTGRIATIDVVGNAINVNTLTDDNKSYKLADDVVIFEVTVDEDEIYPVSIKPSELKDDITTSDLSAKNGFWSTVETINIPAYAVFETNADGDIKALAYTVSPENASLPEANNETLYGILLATCDSPLQYDIFTTDGSTIRYNVSQNANMNITQVSELGKFVAYTLDKFGRISTIVEVDTSMTIGDKIRIAGNSLIDNDGEGDRYTLADDVVIIEIGNDDDYYCIEPKLVALKQLLKKSYIKPVDVENLYGWYDGTISAYAKYVVDGNGKIKVLVYTEDGGNSLQYGVVDAYGYLVDGDPFGVTLVGDDSEYELKNNGYYVTITTSSKAGAFIVYTQRDDEINPIFSIPKEDFIANKKLAVEVSSVSGSQISFVSGQNVVILDDQHLAKANNQVGTVTRNTKTSVITNDSTIVYIIDSSTGKFTKGTMDSVVKNAYVYVPVVDEDGYATVIIVDEYGTYYDYYTPATQAEVETALGL